MAESAGPSYSDDDAVADLHRELAEQLRRLAWAMLRDWQLADDAVQDAFLLLATKCGEVPPQQRHGWLVRTVQYSALNLRRSRQRHQRLTRELGQVREQTSEYQVTGARPSPCALELSEELQRVRQVLSQLPREQQSVVHMRLVENKTFNEIAQLQELPLGTVLSRMRLAMEKLRSKLT